MDAIMQQACLAEIKCIWSGTAANMRPGMVWIARHMPVVELTCRLETSVVAAWFLNNGLTLATSGINPARYVVDPEFAGKTGTRTFDRLLTVPSLCYPSLSP
jgi:hypothetical protein